MLEVLIWIILLPIALCAVVFTAALVVGFVKAIIKALKK